MMKTMVVAGLAVAALAVSVDPALSGSAPRPSPVIVINKTRFEPFARDVLVPAGQTVRFEIRSDGYARASLLVAGTTTAGAGNIGLAVAYGPPFVPVGPPRPLRVDPEGRIGDLLVEPVHGPILAVFVRNDATSDAMLTMSAYLAH